MSGGLNLRLHAPYSTSLHPFENRPRAEIEADDLTARIDAKAYEEISRFHFVRPARPGLELIDLPMTQVVPHAAGVDHQLAVLEVNAALAERAVVGERAGVSIERQRGLGAFEARVRGQPSAVAMAVRKGFSCAKQAGTLSRKLALRVL